MNKRSMATGGSFFVLFYLVTSVALAEGDSTLEVSSLESGVSATKIEAPESEHKIQLKSNLKALIAGQAISDRYMNVADGLTEVKSISSAVYNSWLSFDLQFEAFFVEGNAKNFYGTEGKSQDGFYLDEATVNITPLSFLNLRGGILLTNINPIQSVMNKMAFPGTTQKIALPLTKNWSVTATAEEAVPTSGTVTKGILDNGPTPSFMSQTLQTDATLEPIGTKVAIAMTHFEFANISNNLAIDSNQIGNDPRSFEGIGPAARFRIGFSGFESAASLETKWSRRIKTNLFGSYIENDSAPVDRNTGGIGGMAVTTKFGNFNITPSLKFFRFGADVIPAAYTYLPYRYQNRDGYVATLVFELEREHVSFFASYTSGNVINPNNFIADRQLFTLGMEATRDLL